METCLPQDMKWARECDKFVDLTQYAQEECDGLNSCDFYGKPTYAGDPCFNVMKFTVVNFKCIPGSNYTCSFFLLLFVASCEVPVSHDDFAADLKVRIDALIPDQISNVNQANRSKAWLHKIVDQVSR